CRVPVAGCRVRRGRELGAGARCWLPGAGVAVRAMAYGRTPWLYRQRVLAYAIRRLGGPARRRAAGVGAGRRGMPGGWRLGGPARRRRVGVGAGRRGVPGGRRRDRPARAQSSVSGWRARFAMAAARPPQTVTIATIVMTMEAKDVSTPVGRGERWAGPTAVRRARAAGPARSRRRAQLVRGGGRGVDDQVPAGDGLRGDRVAVGIRLVQVRALRPRDQREADRGDGQDSSEK